MGKKSSKVYIVGHKNPDTDSICSAIAYAHLKREVTGNEYVARRAGQINEETHYVLQKFKVDGGASANDFLLEFQAGIMNMPVYRPQCIETTSLGAAYLAGLATGYWKNRDDILSNWQIDRIFNPDMDQRKRTELLDGWHKAVRCTFGWAR